MFILDGPRAPQREAHARVRRARHRHHRARPSTGRRWPLHSGHYGNWVPNPAMRLAQLLATFKDDGGRVLVEGFYDGITALHARRAGDDRRRARQRGAPQGVLRHRREREPRAIAAGRRCRCRPSTSAGCRARSSAAMRARSCPTRRRRRSTSASSRRRRRRAMLDKVEGAPRASRVTTSSRRIPTTRRARAREDREDDRPRRRVAGVSHVAAAARSRCARARR